MKNYLYRARILPKTARPGTFERLCTCARNELAIDERDERRATRSTRKSPTLERLQVRNQRDTGEVKSRDKVSRNGGGVTRRRCHDRAVAPDLCVLAGRFCFLFHRLALGFTFRPRDTGARASLRAVNRGIYGNEKFIDSISAIFKRAAREAA